MSSTQSKNTHTVGKFTLKKPRNGQRGQVTKRGPLSADEILMASHRHVINNSFLVVLPNNGRPVITTMKISSFRTQLTTALREAIASRQPNAAPLKPFLENEKFNWPAGFAAAMLKSDPMETLMIWPSMGIVSTVAMMRFAPSADAWEKYGKLRLELLAKSGFAPRVNPTWLPAGIADAEASGAVMRVSEAISKSEAGIQQLCTFCSSLFLGLSYERLASKIASNGSTNLSDFNKFASKFISGVAEAGSKGVTGSYTTLLRLYKSCLDFAHANNVVADRKDRKIVVFEAVNGHPGAHSRGLPTDTVISATSKIEQQPTIGSVAMLQRTQTEAAMYAVFREHVTAKIQEENRIEENRLSVSEADIDLFLNTLYLGKITIEHPAANTEDVYAAYMMTKNGTGFSSGLRPLLCVFAKHYGVTSLIEYFARENALSVMGQDIVAKVERAPPKVQKAKAVSQPLNSAAMDQAAFVTMQNRIRQEHNQQAKAAFDAMQRRAPSPSRVSPTGRASPSRADIFANGFGRPSAGVIRPSAGASADAFAAAVQANTFNPAAAGAQRINPFTGLPYPSNMDAIAAVAPVSNVAAQLTSMARESAGRAENERLSAQAAAAQAAAQAAQASALRASAERREAEARILASASAATAAVGVAAPLINPFTGSALVRSSGSATVAPAPLVDTRASAGAAPAVIQSGFPQVFENLAGF